MVCFIVSLAAAQSPVPPNAQLVRIATGFQFVEGPVWKDSVGLLFSDIWPAKVFRWTPESGAVLFLEHSDSSNGLTYDRQGRLILTQMLRRRVARMETDGTITPLASTYKGKKFNSPNDVVVKSDGSIFFTDPNYNIPGGPSQQQLPYCGIFCITTSGNVRLLDSTVATPNGICFSPDESKLFVNYSGQPTAIYVWDVIDDSTIANKRLFASLGSGGYADGMKADSAGNIFCAGLLGIRVFSPTGAVLDTILVPGQTSNCNWGDADRKTLYITSGNSVYKIRLTPATGVQEHGSLIPGSVQLYANYPNPFNPGTIIPYQLSRENYVSLRVYDLLGREVALLANERKAAGSYTAYFDATGLASGLYLYRLKAGEFDQTRKMSLLK